MANFMQPTEDLTLKITVEGKSKNEKLKPDEYYMLSRSNGDIPVLKHDTLIRIAEKNKLKIEKTVLEFGMYNSPNNYCFIHRAFGIVDGVMIDEVGESSTKSLEGDISGAYPAIMSNKRAQDRLLIRMLGLQGQAYSDSEFSGVSTSNQNTNAKNTTNEITNEENPDEEMTIEDAENLIVDYGRYKNNPIPLKELKENHTSDFDWLVNKYTVLPNSNVKMVKLHKAAKLLA